MARSLDLSKLIRGGQCTTCASARPWGPPALLTSVLLLSHSFCPATNICQRVVTADSHGLPHGDHEPHGVSGVHVGVKVLYKHVKRKTKIPM